MCWSQAESVQDSNSTTVCIWPSEFSKGKSPKHWGKMKFKNASILYLIALPCVLLLCSLCVNPQYLWWNWTVKMEGAFLKCFVGNWRPVMLLETTWPHPRSWLGNVPQGVFLAFPQLFPSVIMKKNKEEQCAERKVHSPPSALAAAHPARTSAESDVMVWSNWEKTIKLHCKHLYKQHFFDEIETIFWLLARKTNPKR